MGKLNKQVFAEFAEFECDRQLYLNLGRDDGDWVDPPHKVLLSPRIRRRSPLIAKLGQQYEQEVYANLKRLPQTRYTISQKREIEKTDLTVAVLKRLYNEIINNNQGEKEICLLEYEFEAPQGFIEDLLGRQGTPNLECSANRPDILILGKVSDGENESVRELLPNGETKEVEKNKEKPPRVGINIYDIKSTNELNVGKKHFIEVIFYARALSHFIHIHGLENMLFVRVDNNGILPNSEDFFVLSLEEFREKVVKLNWNDTYRIFTNATEHLQEILKKIPKDITDKNSLEVNICASCGRCNYVEDCKIILGFNRLPPQEWDVRLLPNTSRGISEQLREKKMLTIGSVADQIGNVKTKPVPNPIYPQLPLIKSKATAISSDKTYYPTSGEIYSLAMPKFTEMVLIFVDEYDPTSERVYTIGINLHLMVSPKSKSGYKDLFDTWWRIWREHLDKGSAIDDVKTELDDVLRQEINTREVKEISRILHELWKNPSSQNEEAEIILPKEQKKNKDRTTINYSYTYVSGGMDDKNEAQLAKNSVIILYKLVKLCSCLEFYITSEPEDEDEYVTSPTLAIFYWSNDQLELIQDLIERNLECLISDPEVKPCLEELLTIFSPTESGVRDPSQHKKLYDLRAFAETVVGFPGCVINYTWHEIAERLMGTKSNMRFWMPHFNYMEIIPWHEYLNEYDTNKRNAMRLEISRQVRHKLRTINSLRIEFQKKARALVSRKTRPVDCEKITRRKLGRDYHSLANIWYIYSKLNGAIEEYEADYFRTMYPEFSIGKLQAAEISNLAIIEVQAPRSIKHQHKFELHNLSTNMKISEGSHAIMIPYELRDISYRMRRWQVVIEEMKWVGKGKQEESYYEIVTEPRSKNLIEEAREELQTEPEKWFLYPYASDNWSNKLFKTSRGTGLLQRYQFGESWLGHRLAYLSGIKIGEKLIAPEKATFGFPEIYLYAPEFLPRKRPIAKKLLITTIEPKPDDSQEEAIKFALDSTISMIIGPPGTGKSQTIVALIDEYLERNKGKPVKILVTAYSYAALKVVFDKLQKCKDKQGNKRKAAEIQKVFLRSQSRGPITAVGQDPSIKDLYRYRRTWKLDEQSRIVTSTSKLNDHLEDSFVLLGNAHQLYHLGELNPDGTLRCFRGDFYFDLIIVDEASQLPADYFLSCLQFVRKRQANFTGMNGASLTEEGSEATKHAKYLSLKDRFNLEEITKVVIVGDHNQLPPVQRMKPPAKLKTILSSLFSFYTEGHKVETKQLEINYRSHQDIVDYTAQLGLYERLMAHQKNAGRLLQGNWQSLSPEWVKEVLNTKKVVSTIIHARKFDMAVSPFEAEITVRLILGYYEMRKPKGKVAQKKFWEEEVGIVAPHNAHGRLIIRRIFEELRKDTQIKLNQDELMGSLKAAIVSVEKFQGSDRDLIIASIGISDKDQLAAEEEFIFDLNRFNVLTSRAKSKVILICSKNYLEYLPKQREVMEYSSKIRTFARDFCNKSSTLEIQREEGKEKEEVEFRWKE